MAAFPVMIKPKKGTPPETKKLPLNLATEIPVFLLLCCNFGIEFLGSNPGRDGARACIGRAVSGNITSRILGQEVEHNGKQYTAPGDIQASPIGSRVGGRERLGGYSGCPGSISCVRTHARAFVLVCNACLAFVGDHVVLCGPRAGCGGRVRVEVGVGFEEMAAAVVGQMAIHDGLCGGDQLLAFLPAVDHERCRRESS
ncbi:hypothetical protein F511_09523 [Dorcoceras hygrometricum]|uniref:Uncharacterized protein n=1 Tax=Dorcoceras hygrometricum TaxID=472368 RepID=A0A2Z7BME0_9LAMI|nr:hypothetical protein F511_09523 [Dorcoceras hygrometricum]